MPLTHAVDWLPGPPPGSSPRACPEAAPPIPDRLTRARRLATRLVAALGDLQAAEARITLAEGALLAALVHPDRFQDLGFVRQADFAREALKIHPRTLRRRLALHRLTTTVPSLVDPFLQNRIGVSQLLAIRNVVSEASARLWVTMAGRLPVPRLQRLVRRVQARREAENRVPGEQNPAGMAPGMEATTENRVPEEAPAADREPASAVAIDDPLQEPRRRRLSFLSPRSAGLAIEHGLETAKRVLGYEAPRDACLDAVLAEAEAALALPTSPDEEAPTSPDDEAPVSPDPEAPGSSDDGGPIDRTAASPNDPAAEGAAATENRVPGDRPPSCHKATLKGARRLLASIDRKLAAVHRLTQELSSPGPDTPDPSRLPPAALLDRYLALQRRKNPLRILLARAVHHLSALEAHRLLGHDPSDLHLAARLLDLSTRSARDLIHAGYGFSLSPPLADAFARGHLGLGQVVALTAHLAPDTPAWIRRARSLTDRQLRRELRLRRSLHHHTDIRFDLEDHRFPGSRLEAILRRRLFLLGFDLHDLDRDFRHRGLLTPPGASPDPAENPALMARLESLADLLALEICRRRETATPTPRKTGPLPGPHSRVTVWARDPVARHWHDLRLRILRLSGPLPDWAVAVLCVQAAEDEWYRIDPERIPTERRILERDGYLCQAPGCSSRRALEAHHIIFRSHGGPDADWNLVTLCAMHHRHAVHRRTMRVTGRAPHDLTWELGIEQRPLHADHPFHPPPPARWVYRGDRRIRDGPHQTRIDAPRERGPRTRSSRRIPGRRSAGKDGAGHAPPSTINRSETTCL